MSDDHHKKFGATTPGKRFMKLAGMSASIAGNFAKTASRARSAHSAKKSACVSVSCSLLRLANRLPIPWGK